MNSEWKVGIIKRIEPIFQDVFLDDQLKISETTSPAEILEWDSLAHVNLLSVIEKDLGIQFTAEDMGSIEDVAGLLHVLNRHEALL